MTLQVFLVQKLTLHTTTKKRGSNFHLALCNIYVAFCQKKKRNELKKKSEININFLKLIDFEEK